MLSQKKRGGGVYLAVSLSLELQAVVASYGTSVTITETRPMSPRSQR